MEWVILPYLDFDGLRLVGQTSKEWYNRLRPIIILLYYKKNNESPSFFSDDILNRGYVALTKIRIKDKIIFRPCSQNFRILNIYTMVDSNVIIERVPLDRTGKLLNEASKKFSINQKNIDFSPKYELTITNLSDHEILTYIEYIWL